MLSPCWLIGAYFLAVSSHKRGRLNTSVYGHNRHMQGKIEYLLPPSGHMSSQASQLGELVKGGGRQKMGEWTILICLRCALNGTHGS